MKKETIQKIIAVLILLLVWQIVALLLNRSILLASPIEVIGRLFTIWREDGFWQSLSTSFFRIVAGFLAAFIIGCILAVISYLVHWIEILLSPIMVTIKTVPVASFIIIALVWLTSKELSSFISFLMVLPVIYNNVLEGIKSIEPKMLELADVYRLSFRKRFRYIWIPAVRSYLMAGLTTALGLAWKAGIAAEVIGIPKNSIGEKLYDAKAYLNTVDLFAWTVIIVIICVAFEKIVIFLVKKLLYERHNR